MASASFRAAAATTRAWHTVDASGQVVGRLAQHVARLLQGKNKPLYTPGADCGDYVVILNADKVRFTGRKATDKVYYWHTNHPGGLKQRTAKEMLEKAPERILERAIKGMLPKNRLAKSTMLRRLRVQPSEENLWSSQCKASEAAAGTYLEAFAPPPPAESTAAAAGAESHEVPFLRQHIRVGEPEAIDLDAIGEEALGEPDYDLLRTVFASVWQKEVDFWALRDEVVPEDIYDKHGLPFPGADAEPMTAAAAADRVAEHAKQYWETTGKKEQDESLAALKEFKESAGEKWRGAPLA
ncbi:hypothetical protein FNF27_01966 [Cafeteria roenbergensis]|uniref:Ribosomal protein L13 n=2 Tax=Cafeteria roenbergensis TaxID=33653 RepID=A0A5A8E3V8_CAFRO|nr:hypothetical protein FNF31_00053 [Cafeteria roenbergensis]KAA0170581.1 hypothetical protein FNF28_01343 [Cafeteria roenbergensis]KAA0176685.1 hypothetical protein FNF27_01966 [Cafeteria roenbergensis]